MATPRLFVLVLAILLCGACSQTLGLRANVIEPAGIPVRAFPHVWVERGQLLAEQELAESLVHYLQETSRLDVRLVDTDQLAAARAGGTVRPATVLVVFRLHTRELSRIAWTSRPETICDALGCFTVSRSYNYDIPVMEGELRISVQDAQTAQELQRAVLRARDEGRNYDDMLPRLVASLSVRLQQLTEQRVRAIDVTLLRVKDTDVERALALTEQGDWLAAREVLEAWVTSPALGQMGDLEDRARALYNLSQLRRFGVRAGEPMIPLLKSARKVLEQALSLDTDSRYAAALQQLDDAIRKQTMVEDQRAAADHNFAIDRPMTTPAPPQATRAAEPGTP